jgi:pimeloyl-ACP methyl ester carboxylesterase
MRLEVNGIGLEVEDRGVGPPVVLLHGWPDSHRLWRHQVAALTAAGYRCIVPDLRGFGDSDRPLDVDAYALPNIVGTRSACSTSSASSART